MSNPPVDVQHYGQSIWYDNIQRRLLDNGTFQKLLDDGGVLGVTSNPAIFQKAIGNSDDYDDAISHLLELEPEAIYETLAIKDIQDATDLLRPIYDSTHAVDGYVSLEVSPLLARETGQTIREARRLFDEVDRPNVMIKIPATPQGIPAIEASIAAGINVNVTLIFAVENYIQVAEAYIGGLERRLEAGEDITKIASVASFFLSRIDTMVDQILENNIRAAQIQGDGGRVNANNRLLGQAAIANAKLAYKNFQNLFYGERFAKLRGAGAMVQRPLWASTSTKNPAYSDTRYVDTLIGRDTVSTLPPATFKAFREHGTVAGETILDDIDKAPNILDMLAEVGVEMKQVTQRLQDDGVEAFIEAFEELVSQVMAKRAMLESNIVSRQKFALGIYAEQVQAAIQLLDAEFFNARLWNHDGSLWRSDGPTLSKIQKRLGWLDVPRTIDINRLKQLQASVRGAGFTHGVVLGMGGSSIMPGMMAKTFGKQADFPELLILDSTHPQQMNRITNTIDIAKTIFIVSSQSGTTVETIVAFKHFYAKTGRKGEQFIAITDVDSKLDQLAKASCFRDVFHNPLDIGGRYSALSYYGMVPMALMGLDIDRLWRSANNMMKSCGDLIPAESNPGVTLGAVIGALGQAGRDKICIYASKSIAGMGDWIEQLVAPSLGKQAVGFLPVVGASLGRPSDYVTDRLFIYLKLKDDPSNSELDAGIRALREAGHPRVTLLLEDRYALAGEFFRWQYATAVVGKMLRINPFDEPNNATSKNNTKSLLKHYEEQGSLPIHEPIISGETIDLYASEETLAPLRELCKAHGYDSRSRTELLAAQFIGTKAGDYIALLAYLPQTPTIMNELAHVRRRLRHVTKRAVTLGFGPRYLHATGQFHKGGPRNGVYIMLTADHKEDVTIPDMPYSAGVLCDAQAEGDYQTLEQDGRRVFRLHITGDVIAGIVKLLAAVDFVEERRL